MPPVDFFLPSPPLRGRGVGGEGGYCTKHPLTPDPSPPKRGRGEKENPLTPDPSPPKRGRGEKNLYHLNLAKGKEGKKRRSYGG